MNCKYCKMEVPEGYRYCPNCGLLLDLGKQFTVPERKYTIPKYEYQPKKAEAEAAAPETTQQFLQPQHEESTEEAEARLELELRKALERDARALAAEKKPTEAVEFSDEDYAQVEQDETPDAIELEEKQPSEPVAESVVAKTSEEPEDTASAEPEEAAAEEMRSEAEEAEEAEVSGDTASAESEVAVEAQETEVAAPAESEVSVAEEMTSEAEEADAAEVAEEETFVETEPDVVKSEEVELAVAEAEMQEAVSGEEAVSSDAEEAEAAEAANAETAEETEGTTDVAMSSEIAEAEETLPELIAETSEKETEESTEEIAAENNKEPEDSASAETTDSAEVSEAAENKEAELAETVEVEDASESAEELKDAEIKEAVHAELEERLAALLPDDGLDSTKVDEQGNPAFVWDENISFMEAVSEKSVGDFAIAEETEPSEEITEAAVAEEHVESETEETLPQAETEAATEDVPEMLAEPEQVLEVEAEADATAAPAGAEDTEIAGSEVESEPELPVEAEVSAADEAVAETEETTEQTEAVAEVDDTTVEPDGDTETAAAETEAPGELEATAESDETVDVTAEAEEKEASAKLCHDDEKCDKKRKRFLIPLAVCAVAAGAVVVYLNLPTQLMNRALHKGRNYIESSNFTAAVPVLEKLLQEQPDSLEVHLLLADAYANTDQHAQAVALLEEAKVAYPDNAELIEKLAELNPTVTVSVPSGDYSDPQSIALSNEKGYEIRYQLNDEPEQTYEDEILLSTNGTFTLSAYAVASDGGKGESVNMDYTIQLDPEKYALDQFVDTAEGRQYVDADGAVQTGWMTKDGKTYYFDEKGYMLTGLQTIEGSSYFFDADGVLSTGWQQQDGKYYFFDEMGRMLTSTWIDNQYYVGEDGAMLIDTTTPDGVYVNARGQRGFDAASEFANYPNSIVQAHISTKVDKGDYYEVSASVYHQKTDNKPTGESYDITLKVRKHAKVHYLDNNLPDIIASDAFSFLKEIGMQKIQQDNEGYVTEFSFALGEKRS